MNVSAPNGNLVFADGDLPSFPASYSEGQNDFVYAFRRPQNAESMHVHLWIEGENEYRKEIYQDDVGEGGIITFSETLELNQWVRVDVNAQASGYNEASLGLNIPVVSSSSTADAEIVFRDDEEAEELTVYVGQNAEVIIRPTNPTKPIKAVRLFGGYDLWEERGPEEDGCKYDGPSFGDEGDYTLYALVTFDEWPEGYEGDDPREWVSTNTLTVHVSGYAIGTYNFASLAPVTVKRGENVVFEFTPAEGADHYWVDVTWGDPVFAGQQEQQQTLVTSYNYLCCSDAQLSATHIPEADFALPSCSDESYDYYRMNGLYYEYFDYDTVYSALMNSVWEERRYVTFKFGSKEAYDSAMYEFFSNGMLQEPAQYLMDLYGLNTWNYRYNTEEEFHLITIYWRSE